MATDPSREKPEDDVVGRTSEHHFISYSRHDSKFVERLKSELEKGQPRFRVWMDQSEIGIGSWTKQLEDAIDTCHSFLLVVSDESNKSEYVPNELDRARSDGKPIIPLILDSEVKAPLQAGGYQCVYFLRDGDFGKGLAQLRKLLKEVELQKSLKEPESRAPVYKPRPASPVVINAPPLIAPTYFQGRDELCRTIEEFLSDDTRALLWISGRVGSGKTALACRVLEKVRLGARADKDQRIEFDAIAYVDQKQQSREDWRKLFDELHYLEKKSEVELQKSRQGCLQPFEVQNVLTNLADRRIVLLIDHLDDLIDFKTRNMRGQYLQDALQTVLTVTTHRLKVIVTSIMHPLDFSKGYEGRWLSLNLAEGLPALEATQMLKALDRGGTLGIQGSDEKHLKEICQRAMGNPRAIEALYALLRDSPNASIKSLLEDKNWFLPEEVLNVLIGESYACLDNVSKTMMQVLLASQSALTADAVVSVFHHYYPKVDHPTIDPQQVLTQLVNLQLVQNSDEGYSLKAADRWYVAAQLADGVPPTIGGLEGVHLDRTALFRQFAEYLQAAGAEALPRQLDQFDFLYKGQDYAAAADVLKRLETLLYEKGRYQELARCYERLDGKLHDTTLIRHRLDTLARTYHRLGDLARAAQKYEEGLACVRDAHDPIGECSYLANLAICTQEFGDLVGATLYCMAALELAQQTEQGAWEAHIWNIIGETLAHLGLMAVARQASERALALMRDKPQLEIKQIEVVALLNLGEYSLVLGDIKRAQRECDDACRIAVTNGFQLGESATRRNLGIIKLSGPLYKLSAKDFKDAMLLADVTQNVQLQQTTRIELATALLRDDKLSNAEAIADEAVRYDTPLFSPQAYALHGVVLQRLGKVHEAAESFEKALEKSAEVLQRTSRYYRALDAMGLSYSGLTLTKGEEYLDLAINAYRAAHKLTPEPGIVRRRLLLFDALAQADSGGKLALVRKAIASEQC